MLSLTLYLGCVGGHLHGLDSPDAEDSAQAETGEGDTAGDTSGDSGGDSGRDSGDTGPGPNPFADGDGDGFPDAWAETEYWEESPLASLLLPTEVPDGTHWEVRIATSTDRLTWEPDNRVIAHGFSSLDLIVAGEMLILAGMVDGAVARDLPASVQGYNIPAIATADLETWGSQTWPIGQGSETNVVDPSLQLGSDGVLRATWFAHSTPGVDPATIEGIHLVQRGTWSDTGTFIQDDFEEEFAEEWLADPVICELDGTPWMFYTHFAERIRAARSTDGGGHFEPVTTFSWEEPSVPFCIAEEDGIRVIAQTSGGRFSPRQGWVASDGSFTEIEPLYEDHPWGDNCTSPVVGYWQERWVLACAVQVQGE